MICVIRTCCGWLPSGEDMQENGTMMKLGQTKLPRLVKLPRYFVDARGTDQAARAFSLSKLGASTVV